MTGRRKEEAQLLLARLKKAIEEDGGLTVAELKERFGALGIRTIRRHAGEQRLREVSPRGVNQKANRLKNVIARVKGRAT